MALKTVFEYCFNAIEFYPKSNRFVLASRRKSNHFVLKIRLGGFADYKVTTKAKEIYKEDWEGSSARSLLNQMRKYVRGQENTFQWNNLLISSMTAVIAKGDDWEQLLTFMQSKYMFDYRLAFAFWGELNGFANLTRDFTDNFFTIDDRNYVADVYKELYGQLLGIDPVLSNGRPIIIEKEVPIQEVNQSYEKEIEDIIRNCGCKSAKKDLTIYKEICNHTKGINEKFLKEIKDDKRINKGKGPQKKWKTVFGKKYILFGVEILKIEM